MLLARLRFPAGKLPDRERRISLNKVVGGWGVRGAIDLGRYCQRPSLVLWFVGSHSAYCEQALSVTQYV